MTWMTRKRIKVKTARAGLLVSARRSATAPPAKGPTRGISSKMKVATAITSGNGTPRMAVPAPARIATSRAIRSWART